MARYFGDADAPPRLMGQTLASARTHHEAKR
jgi:hypothetical protein